MDTISAFKWTKSETPWTQPLLLDGLLGGKVKHGLFILPLTQRARIGSKIFNLTGSLID